MLNYDRTLPTTFHAYIDEYEKRFPNQPSNPFLFIIASEQRLYLVNHKKIEASYTISTAKAGLGNQKDSFKTPLGFHSIAEKIGKNAKLGSIFKARRNTFTRANLLTQPDESSPVDIITSRILWLKGMEETVNKGGDVDTFERYIYIHGTDEEGRLGQPVSHGCIRMKNTDIIELFNTVIEKTPVMIIDNIPTN